MVKYNFNHHFFKHGLTSPQHAWLYGFFCSDGSVRFWNDKPAAVLWQLKYSDHDILTKVTRVLSGNQKTVFYATKSNGKRWPAVRDLFYSVEFANDVASLLGCDPKMKSLSLKNLDHLETNHVDSLLLGIFDGDGSLSFSIDLLF